MNYFKLIQSLFVIFICWWMPKNILEQTLLFKIEWCLLKALWFEQKQNDFKYKTHVCIEYGTRVQMGPWNYHRNYDHMQSLLKEKS